MATKHHEPDIKKAVEMLVYMIESETGRPNGGNREVVAASRNALKALIGSRNLDKAKEFLSA